MKNRFKPGLTISAALAFSVMHASNALAVETDFGLIALGRLRTPAFIVEAQGGASQVLWGDPATNPIFGYVRASGGARTSGVANGYRAQLELYPVSLLGVTVGTQGLYRSVDAPGVDCARYECRGWVQSHYLQFRSVVGFSGNFAQILYQRDFYEDRPSLAIPLFDSVTLLPLQGTGDHARSWTAVVGRNFAPHWAGGALWMHSKSPTTRAHSASAALFARWTPAEVTYTLGIGRGNSSVAGVGAQALATLSWWPKPRVGF